MSIPTPNRNRLELEEEEEGEQTQMKEVDTSTSISSFGEKDEISSAVDGNADPTRTQVATKLGLEGDYNDMPALARGKGIDDTEEYEDDEEGLVHTSEGTRIRSGEDVANYAIPLIPDPPSSPSPSALTPRSIILGTLIAGLGAALSQIYLFKPTDVYVSSVFLMLLILGLGRVWEGVFGGLIRFVEGNGGVEFEGGGMGDGRREEEHLGTAWRGGWWRGRRGVVKFLRWLNPGPFGMKEHVVATLIATTAGTGSTAVNNFAVQRLFYDSAPSATTSVLATFSTATFGYGLVGLLRPLTVYPSEMVYWASLPLVLTFQTLHFDKTRTSKRLKLFWSVLGGTVVYELLPQYIFPLLNGLSIPCLATQSSSPSVRRTVTNLFGGAEGNEGLGLLELGFDWQYITSSYLVYPVVQQVNSWIGFALCYAAVAGIYYADVWDAKKYPFLSTSIFSNTSTPGHPVRYNQTAVFGPTFTLNQTALDQHGIPQYAGAYVWTLMASNWAVGGLFAHCVLFWGKHVVDSIKLYSKYQAAHRAQRERMQGGNDSSETSRVEGFISRVDEKRLPPPTVTSFADPLSPSSPEGLSNSLSARIRARIRTRAAVTDAPVPSAGGAPNPTLLHPGEPIQRIDRHYLAMMKYPEAPWWWYLLLLVLSFIAGLVVVIKGDTTLPVWGYIIALIVGTIITPFSNLLTGRLGNGIATNLLVKMIAGALHPGKPVANLYFSMWSHDVVNTAIHLATDLKIGQYLKIPPRVMFVTQVWGTIIGCIVNYVVMVSIVTSKRDVLLDPQGTNAWSGQTVQALNSQAVTWSLASQVFGIHSKYIWVPVGLLLGAIPTVIQWLIWRRWPKIGPVPVDMIVLPVIYQYAQWLTTGVNSVILTTVAAGLVSQVWLRRYHPRWFRKYLYILGGAIDGGTQTIVFVLAFAVFGASGVSRPFPNWWGNPSTDTRNIDYCASTN